MSKRVPKKEMIPLMNDLQNDYRTIAAFSDNDADIYASESIADYMRDKTRSQDVTIDLMHMQIAQEKYENVFIAVLDGISRADIMDEGAELQTGLSRAYRRMVSDRIGACSREDQQGILCRAIYQGKLWLGENMRTYDLLQLGNMSTESLINECAYIAQRLTVKALAGMSFDEADPEIRPIITYNESVRMSAAATEIANYLNTQEEHHDFNVLAAAAVAGKQIGGQCAGSSSNVIYTMLAAAAVVFCGGLLIDALIALSVCSSITKSIDISDIRRRLTDAMGLLIGNIGFLAGFAITGATCRLPAVLQQMYDSLAHREKGLHRKESDRSLYNGNVVMILEDEELESEDEGEEIKQF